MISRQKYLQLRVSLSTRRDHAGGIISSSVDVSRAAPCRSEEVECDSLNNTAFDCPSSTRPDWTWQFKFGNGPSDCSTKVRLILFFSCSPNQTPTWRDAPSWSWAALINSFGWKDVWKPGTLETGQIEVVKPRTL
jgi:hypothetical protein